MSEQTNPTQPTQQAAATTGAVDAKPTAQRAVSDPREVAAIVMARMQQVKAKKDEMGAAMDALVDITQQLTRTYGAQLVVIEHLRRRVKELEAQVASQATAPQTIQ
jgi:hypothetical protein